jgi:uncharacterized protein with HEPN domain
MSNVTPSPSERDPRLYVKDMRAFCELVLEFTQGVEREAFFADRMRRDATLRNLELIGEAATRVPDAIRALAPDVPWRKIIATRNRLIHAYLGIEADAVWGIVAKDVPVLRLSLLALLALV